MSSIWLYVDNKKNESMCIWWMSNIEMTMGNIKVSVGGVCFSVGTFLFSHSIYFVNCSVIALQGFVGFCCATTWISCVYKHVLSPWSLPPTPPPSACLGHHRALSWAPCAIYSRFPLAICFTHSSTLAWKSHGWRSLVGCSAWSRTESDTTEAT